MKSLFFVAGEESGDMRGAELLRALRAAGCEHQFFGAGGSKMAEFCGEPFLHWTGEAVVGLWDVLRKYGYFRKQFALLLRRIAQVDPEAVVFIDYPGFNLRLAQALRRRRTRAKLIQYVSPQVWAWNRGRVARMAKYLDLMLCIFPFEPEIYEASGLRAVFVGHPIIDSLTPLRTGERRDSKLVGIFPGSRTKEIERILPPMIVAAERLKFQRPQIRFEAAAASAHAAEEIERQLRTHPAVHGCCRVRIGNAYGLMQRAAAGMIASGTATLEAAFFGLPMIIVYRVAWPTWEVGRRLVRVPFLGIVNILAGKEIAREFLQDDAQPEAMAAEVLRLIEDKTARMTAESEYRRVIARLGEPGASGRAAAAVLDVIGQ
jgi:lipid-A-disaccharide synthase